MAVITNARDIALQATSPRLGIISSNYISLTTPTAIIKQGPVDAVPSTLNIIAKLNGELKGATSWSTSPSISFTTDGTGTVLTLSAVDVPITGVVVTASTNYLGQTYSASLTISRTQELAAIQLSKDTVSIQTNPDGSGGVYTSAASTASIYVGSTDDSANWTYSWTVPAGVTTTGVTTRTISITDMSVDTATLTCTATKTGWTTQTKTLTVAKVKNGSAGQVIYLASSALALTKSSSNTYTPSTLTFYAYAKLGTNAPGSYSGIFKVYENGSATASQTSPSAQTQATYTPSATCTSIKVELYDTTGATLMDSLGVATVVNGSSAVQVVLSNENHTYPANSSGTISSYAGSGTAIYLYEGASLIPYDGVGTSNNSWKVTTSVTSGTITVGSPIADSGDFATVPAHSAMTTDSAVITYTITGKTANGTAISLTKSQSLSKAKQGSDGATPDTSSFLTTYSSYILSGNYQVQTSGGFRAGNLTWNSSGALTGGSGVAITAKGLVGASGGVPTFTITETGSATFKGDVITAGDGVFEGRNITSITQTINNNPYGIDYSLYGSATAAPVTGKMRTGVLGKSVGSTSTSAWGTGVLGVGDSTTNGIGVLGSGGAIGGWFENKTTTYAAVYAINQQYTGGVATAIIANGSIVATHDVVAYSTSDRRLKENIKRIRSPLSKIHKISGVNFTWKNSYLDSINGCVGQSVFVPKYDIGIIAQDVQKVVPEAVNTRVDGTLSVNYEKLVPLLLEGIKELSKKVELLERKLNCASSKY